MREKFKCTHNPKIMNVKIVSITQSLVEAITMTAEELIVYTARVSNPSNQMNTESSERLINYLVQNKHWSPFEMAHLCVEVKTSRAIAAQILRHWSLAVQEFSQRYAEVTEMEPVQIRRQAASNRQSSTEEFDPIISYPTVQGMTDMPASEAIESHLFTSQELYRNLLAADVAKECARMILPLTTQTTMYLNGDIRTWIFYLLIRTDAHAQLEHRQVATAILDIFRQQFPTISKALEL
jgi:thymidylate synthase (FAD)